MIRDVTDLNVYQESLRLIPKLYGFLGKLLYSEDSLVNQSKRAAQSIAANLAEGFGKRGSGKEFRRYILISIGSSDELITHIRMISLISPKLTAEANELIEEYKILSKRLNKLHKTWKF